MEVEVVPTALRAPPPSFRPGVPVPRRVVESAAAVAEALFHDGKAPPPAARMAWLADELGDFLGRSGGRARLLFRLCLFVVSWIAPLLGGRCPPLRRLDVDRRLAILTRLEEGPLSAAFLGVKAILCILYYEHPDAAREAGFDGHQSGVAR